MPGKFELECALVTRLLAVLGMPGVLSDPRKTYGREIGADVEVRAHVSKRCGMTCSAIGPPRSDLRQSK
jgi:hypothetical protein